MPPDDLNLDDPAPSAEAEVVSPHEAKRIIHENARPFAPMGRTLPHSLEAEEAVLSAILIDPEATIPLVQSAGLSPDSFHDTRHAIVLRAILSLHRQSQPVATDTVALHLASTRELDAVGSYPFLTQISSKQPTTAQAKFFIDRVREQSILRNLIRSAAGVVEGAYNFSGGIEEFAAEAQERMKSAVNGYAGRAETELATRRYDPAHLIERPDAIYSIAGIPVCTPGNLTTLYAQAKAGKSSFMGAMLAATMTTPTSNHDTLGLTGPNYGKKAVLHFDTEQSIFDWQEFVRRALKRVGLTAPPAWFYSFSIAGLSADKAEQFVHLATAKAAKAHGGIHSVHLDGVADLVNDPNSSDECFPLVTRLHALAITQACPVINVLHLNPTARDKADKGRGHLGSQLERKSESNLTLKKDGDVTQVVAEGRQRGRPIPAAKCPAFRWSDEHQMHVSCPQSGESAPKSSGGKHATYEITDYLSVFPAHSSRGDELNPLWQKLQTNKPIKKDTLHHALKRWAQDGAVEIITEPQRPNRYRLAV